MEYKIHPQVRHLLCVRIRHTCVIQTPGSRGVGRRYKQFDWLHEQLVNKFRFVCIPPLPGKQMTGTLCLERERFHCW